MHCLHAPKRSECSPYFAGQAIVQMARSKYDAMEYAIKFYVSHAAFKAESALYSQRTTAQVTELAQFLPQVRFG